MADDELRHVLDAIREATGAIRIVRRESFLLKRAQQGHGAALKNVVLHIDDSGPDAEEGCRYCVSAFDLDGRQFPNISVFASTVDEAIRSAPWWSLDFVERPDAATSPPADNYVGRLRRLEGAIVLLDGLVSANDAVSQELYDELRRFITAIRGDEINPETMEQNKKDFDNFLNRVHEDEEGTDDGS